MDFISASDEFAVNGFVVLAVKPLFFGIFKRQNHVFIESTSDAKKHALLPIIRGRVSLNSVIHADGWRAYGGLVDVGCAKHLHDHHATMN